MYWQNLLINRMPAKQELAEALACVFRVEQEDVLIAGGVIPPSNTLEFRVVCLTTIVRNAEYLLALEIILANDLSIFGDDIQMIGKLSEQLQACALASIDHEINPYVFHQICSPTDYKKITYDDVDACDEREAYELV